MQDVTAELAKKIDKKAGSDRALLEQVAWSSRRRRCLSRLHHPDRIEKKGTECPLFVFLKADSSPRHCLGAGCDLRCAFVQGPDLECRKDCNQTTDNNIDRHGVAILEPEQPGRYDEC